MTSFQGNETALHQLTADCMLDTTDVLLISCLLIGLATYFLLAAFMLDTKIGRYFISIAETIDLCRPGSAIASIVSTARRMKEFVASYLSRKKPAAMGLAALSGDEQGILFVQLCNVLDPRGLQHH